MTVCRKSAVKAAAKHLRLIAQVEGTNDPGRAEVEMSLNTVGDIGIRNTPSTKAVDLHAYWPCNSKGVCKVDLTGLRQAGGNDILRGIARGIRPHAIYPGGVLARQRGLGVAGIFAVSIDCALATGQSGVQRGPSLDDKPFRINENMSSSIGAQLLVLEHRLNHMLVQVVT